MRIGVPGVTFYAVQIMAKKNKSDKQTANYAVCLFHRNYIKNNTNYLFLNEKIKLI